MSGRARAAARSGRARERMVERQLRRRGIPDERVLAAMARVPRDLFVPEQLRHLAYEDGALPIGHGQTISQPYIVATICSLLGAHGDERVLDVGTGSGYQAAVLAELAAEVVTIERMPELAERGARRRSPRPDTTNVEVRVGDGSLGVPDRAPFDAIAVAAAAPASRRRSTSSSSWADGSSSRAVRAGGRSSCSWSARRDGPVERAIGPVPLRPAGRRRRFRADPDRWGAE